MQLLCKNPNKNLFKRLEAEGIRVPVNNSSRIVLISDVHRGNGSYSDSLRNNANIYKAALEHYYKKGFTLIEVGDGDELWKNKNILDIAYAHDAIYRLLEKFYKKNRLYMLYGNHDMIKKSPKFVSKLLKKYKDACTKFPQALKDIYSKIKFHECVVLEHEETKKSILVFHGHQVDTFNCEFWHISRFLVRHIWKFLSGTGGMNEPTSPASNFNKADNIDKILMKMSEKYKKMIICGHTHNDIMPEPGKSLYFNDGCCVFPRSITALEIENNEICLVEWSIDVDDNRTLIIKRNITYGPQKLAKYLAYADS